MKHEKFRVNHHEIMHDELQLLSLQFIGERIHEMLKAENIRGLAVMAETWGDSIPPGHTTDPAAGGLARMCAIFPAVEPLRERIAAQLPKPEPKPEPVRSQRPHIPTPTEEMAAAPQWDMRTELRGHVRCVTNEAFSVERIDEGLVRVSFAALKRRDPELSESLRNHRISERTFINSLRPGERIAIHNR